MDQFDPNLRAVRQGGPRRLFAGRDSIRALSPETSSDLIGFCTTCGYDLRATANDRCPECGEAAGDARELRLGAMPIRLRTMLRVGACLLAFDVVFDAALDLLDLPHLFSRLNPGAVLNHFHLGEVRAAANAAGVLLLAGPRITGGNRRLAWLAVALSITQALVDWVQADWISVPLDLKMIVLWLALAALALVLPTYGRPIFRRVPDRRAAATAGWLRWAMPCQFSAFGVATWAVGLAGHYRDIPDSFTAAGDAIGAALDCVALWLLWRLFRGTFRRRFKEVS